MRCFLFFLTTNQTSRKKYSFLRTRDGWNILVLPRHLFDGCGAHQQKARSNKIKKIPRSSLRATFSAFCVKINRGLTRFNRARASRNLEKCGGTPSLEEDKNVEKKRERNKTHSIRNL
jgi:hypothetical protein